MNYKLILFFSIYFFIGSCSAIKKHQSEDELKLIEFDQFINHIQSNYAYLDTRIEEFNCIKETYRKEVLSITTRKEHIHFYETILMELWDGHLHTNWNTKGSYLSNYLIYTEFSNGTTRV